jgi:hypothetical protein
MLSENEAGREDYQDLAAAWLALSVDSISPFRSSSPAATYDQDPEAGAVALISTLRERCSKLGLAESFVCTVIDIVREDAIIAASKQRAAGRLGEARATAKRLMTLARQLVREYPRHANSYRVLTDAYNQIKKNAMRINDDRLAEESLVNAIQASPRALALNSDLAAIRDITESLTAQLASIRADRKLASSAPSH